MIKKTLTLLLFTCACVCSRAQVNIITTIAGNGVTGYAGDGGAAINAEFNTPYQMCFFKNLLYIADGFNHRIRKIDLITDTITTVAGTATPGYNGDNIAASGAQLLVPEGVCVDTLGNVYIADGGNYRVRKITVATGVITTIAGTGVWGHSGDGGSATNAQIAPPAGLSFDKAGNLFFVEGSYVRKVSPAGQIYTVAGNGTAGYSGDNGPATNAELNIPNKVTVDNYGNLIISEGLSYVLRRVDVATGIITTIAGNGTLGYSGDNGPATNAMVGGVAGGFVDEQNSFYFSQWDNGVIRKIDGATGIITTVVGCGLQGFSGDGGPCTAAKLLPSDICIDSLGTMYIVDYGNNRIRKVYNPKLAVSFETLAKQEVHLYPNPIKNELTVEHNFSNNEDGVFQLMDLTGRLVAAQKLNRSNSQTTVKLNSLPQGMYLYKVLQNSMLISTGKIIKE